MFARIEKFGCLPDGLFPGVARLGVAGNGLAWRGARRGKWRLFSLMLRFGGACVNELAGVVRLI